MNKTINPSRRVFAAGGVAYLATMGTTLPFSAHSQPGGFPTRAIKFVVPFPPRRGTDINARLFAKTIGEICGQAVTVENKPSDNGFVGVAAALSAPPDGYTVFIGSNSTFSTNAATFTSLPYDPIADFTPITVIARGSCLLLVPQKSPHKTLGDLIADAREHPTELHYGSGSVSYTLFSEWFNELAKIKTTCINYEGSEGAINATLAGTVDFAVVGATGAYELVKSGRVRALAYTGDKRALQVPDVPTSAEVGFPEFLPYNWVGAAVSSKTPPEVVKRLGELFTQAAATQEIRDFYAKVGAELPMNSPQDFRKIQKDEIARWKRLAQESGLVMQ
jgi:tripartite-type tricarboxylate transporter receptor subunit TctC